ncbi:hypothetical protein GWK47_013278 [Chionoecetes opilio]|uniref:Uncharacterized protein n=1 Tax=Chionoecetes opilio TaxID=41210 RepID=A0A8J4XVK9_CHIOP|nr:hypothetical protein GWK47_013278 [Chionoecetes opilio]
MAAGPEENRARRTRLRRSVWSPPGVVTQGHLLWCSSSLAFARNGVNNLDVIRRHSAFSLRSRVELSANSIITSVRQSSAYVTIFRFASRAYSLINEQRLQSERKPSQRDSNRPGSIFPNSIGVRGFRVKTLGCNSETNHKMFSKIPSL